MTTDTVAAELAELRAELARIDRMEELGWAADLRRGGLVRHIARLEAMQREEKQQ